jgi:hypothetical protein
VVVGVALLCVRLLVEMGPLAELIVYVCAVVVFTLGLTTLLRGEGGTFVMAVALLVGAACLFLFGGFWLGVVLLLAGLMGFYYHWMGRGRSL